MEWIKIAGPAVVAWIVNFLKNNQVLLTQIAGEIVKRVEKMLADGKITQNEIDVEVEDVFNKYAYPRLPWYLKVLPKSFWLKILRGMIQKICDGSKKIAEK